jgi:sugar O-acyltransferase (sialic acid O-acetyltransferase NeuD family)
MVNARRRVVVAGAGGHGTVVAEAAMMSKTFTVVGFVDDDPGRRGTELLGLPVLGAINDLTRLADVDGVLIGIGGVGDNTARRMVYMRIVELGFDVPAVVHPASFVAPSAHLSSATFVAAGAIVGTNARIGTNTICNTSCVVDHDCVIGAASHIAPGASLSGNVMVGDDTHIGTNATVIQGVRIGDRALVAAGAVVVGDVAPGTRVAGNPARRMRAASLASMESAAPLAVIEDDARER